MITKQAIFERYLKEYLKETKEEKGNILDNVCDVTGLHRKSAVRKFRILQMKDHSLPEKRGRSVFYTPDSISALKTVWEVGSEVCGELLHPLMSEYVSVLKRDTMWNHSMEATQKLLSMSEATVKRRVGNFMKARKPRKGISSTKPSHIKSIIPIFIGPWEGKPPGYGQIDTVVHCGSRLSGNMAYSVNYTDVSTLWVVLGAQLNKGQAATRNSLERMKEKTPFPIHGMHPDTGSEFVNFHLKGWCDDEKIELTRSRPNHKNDNAYVEQKNGHVIRRFLGYSRIDATEAISAMNELYNILEMYLNHFVGSRKCFEKIRIGARYRRKYDKARPAYRRVLENRMIDEAVKERLREEHEKLNPLLLKKEVDRLVSKVFTLQRDCGNKI